MNARTIVRSWGCLLALAAAGIACEPSATPKRGPDVLLVVLDTVRADRTSTYGYGRPTTPQLDAVARSGVVFEDATAAAPWTWPSHASLFTGQPPWVHGAHLVVPAEGSARGPVPLPVSRLRSDLPTLAERFGAAGYRTRAFVANAWLRPKLGLMRGFEVAEQRDSDAEVVSLAASEIRRDDPRPLFLFVNLLSAHTPFREGPGPWAAGQPSPLEAGRAPAWARPYLTSDLPLGIDLSQVTGSDRVDGVTRFLTGELVIPPEGMELLSRLYDAGVRGADFAFGEVLGAWVERFPEGVVAVTSDHGEALGEHGQLHHLGSVYPEVLRVPLVLAAPGRLPAGVRVATPVRLQDVGATLLDVAGVASSPDSLLPLLGGRGEVRPIEAAAWPNAIWATRLGGRFAHTWHLHREGDRALIWDEDGDAELYDLRADPRMDHDLAAREPERVQALLARARAQLDATPEREGQPLTVDEETLARLRQLGYLDAPAGSVSR